MNECAVNHGELHSELWEWDKQRAAVSKANKNTRDEKT